MQWTIIDYEWPAGNKLHVPPGAIIDGITDKYGELIGARWGGEAVPLPLPINCMPMDAGAANEMARWHGESLHLIRPGPGITIVPFVDAFEADRRGMAEAANKWREEQLQQRAYEAHVNRRGL